MVMKKLPQLSSPVNSISQVQHPHGCLGYLFYLWHYYHNNSCRNSSYVGLGDMSEYANSKLSEIEKMSPNVSSCTRCLCAI